MTMRGPTARDTNPRIVTVPGNRNEGKGNGAGLA